MYSVELKPMVGRQKSYYGKAHIIFMGDCIVLKSYETLVMAYNVKAKTIEKLWPGYSATTMKHITSFIEALHLIDYDSNFPVDARLQGGKSWWNTLEMDTKYPKTVLYRDM